MTRSTTRSTPQSIRLLSKGLLALAILAFVGYLAIYSIYAFALFRFPYDYDQGEGFELNDSILFSQGEWPYKSNEQFPFYASNYGPVYHLMVLPLFPIFGQTLAAGRVLSFVVTLIIGIVVYRVVNDKTGDRPIALLSGLMIFASTFVYHIGPLFRQHMTMVFFELLAVVMISKYDHPRLGRRYVLLSMLFLLLAGYTKQLSAATSLAVLAFLFLRAPRKALVAGFGLAASAGLLFLGLTIATQGQWFVNSITANVNAYDYRQAVDLYGQFFSLHFLIAALAIAAVFYELYWGRLSAYGIWFAFALVNAALSGKWGAGESYFTTAVVAASITSGVALGRLKGQLPQRWPRSTAALAIMIPLLYLGQAWGIRHFPTDGPIFGPLADLAGVGRGASVYEDYPYFDAMGYTQVGHLPTDTDRRQGDRIAAYAQSNLRPSLSEEAMFALRANQPVVGNPTQLLNLWNNDALDPTELITMIHEQAFNVVVLRAQFYPPPVLQAIGARYEPIDDIWMNGFQYRILGPRQDIGAGCDEARLYAMKHDLERIMPAGELKLVARDTTPHGWIGMQGASELAFRFDDAATEAVAYHLWIAPLEWQGTPSSGESALLLGSNSCFRFFDLATQDLHSQWPSASDDVRRLFDIRLEVTQ